MKSIIVFFIVFSSSVLLFSQSTAPSYNKMYRGQVIDKILEENADCTNPVLITDTIVFSPHTPEGSGNKMEITDNQPDDLLYFEKEHNTIWYKFSAIETGKLTFDIIPVNKNDDYDFMLFKYTGGHICPKIISKQIKPIRTCISRNDKKIKSMTGLSFDPSTELYVHSGKGPSYVQYINVQKGESYYLLVDNVHNNGNGHTIRLHYKPYQPGELFVGQLTLLRNVTFKDSDTEFKSGSSYAEALDSLYKFLISNPLIKIEILGHINASDGNTPTQLSGKPRYTPFQLSEQRALVIHKFLIDKGIDPERLIPKGYGGTRKKIQHPKTKQECYVNIRIEILILSLDYKKDSELSKKYSQKTKQEKARMEE